MVRPNEVPTSVVQDLLPNSWMPSDMPWVDQCSRAQSMQQAPANFINISTRLFSLAGWIWVDLR